METPEPSPGPHGRVRLLRAGDEPQRGRPARTGEGNPRFGGLFSALRGGNQLWPYVFAAGRPPRRSAARGPEPRIVEKALWRRSDAHGPRHQYQRRAVHGGGGTIGGLSTGSARRCVSAIASRSEQHPPGKLPGGCSPIEAWSQPAGGEGADEGRG